MSGGSRAGRVEELFQAALDLDAAARAELLARESDAELRAEVESLLAHHDVSAKFLEEPLVAREFAAPRQIGPYRVIRELGAGGMGVVYLAEQPHPQRQVALKVLRPGVATPRALRRFEHEALALARLQHPGIAQIHEAGTADWGFGPQPYFAMEFVRGPELADFVEKIGLGTRRRLALLASACDAVAHAHQRGVVHRDLKPSNLLVDDSTDPPQVKVLDFGIARVADVETRTTSLRTDVGQVVGTLSYMSPEQASGDPDSIDERSDVYALGVIGYELLCGRLPLDVTGKPLHEAVRIVREDEPTPLSRVVPALRGDVETIFAKALEKDVARRYASATDFAADLRRYLGEQPIAARPASRWYVLGKFARRNKAVVAGVAGVFIVLVAGIAGTSWQAIEAASARDDFDAAAKEADREARRARAVAKFQQEMLARVRPERDGRDVKLADVLDAAAAGLPGELAGDAASEAAVRSTLGVSYLGLGLLAQAEEQLARAHELDVQALGARNTETLEVQSRLAEVVGDRGDTTRALELARGAFEGLREVAGAEHEVTLLAELQFAHALNKSGDPAAAEAIARTNLAIRRRVFGERNRHVATALSSLGGFLWKLGRLEEAEPHLREAFEIGLEAEGERHPSTLSRMGTLATCLRHRGNVEEAEQIYRRALELGRDVLGPSHVDTLTWMNNLAALLTQKKAYEESGALLREVIEVRTKALGADHADTLIATNNLALLESETGNYAGAEELHRRTLAIKRAKLGDDHRSTLSSIHNLALALLLQGKLDDALVLFREASDRAPRALPAGHWQIASYRESFGACLQRMGRLDEAEPELTAALEAMRTSFPDTDARVTSIAGRLYDLYNSRGDTTRAAEVRERFSSSSKP